MAFTVKTKSSHNRYTQLLVADTGIFPSFFDASEDLGWIVWSCPVTELDAVLFFCFCPVFAHMHSLIHCSFYLLMLLLAFSIWLAVYSTQMEFVSSDSHQIHIQSKINSVVHDKTMFANNST
ncbi:hypothetical protein GOODEAATRI_034343 [Goodea atripinnis]|uniref:Uncharacterized protein n=1 Tax=Goodea atripinnis TaxID=208336 RepID=A0ABV0NIG3_9TELE